MMTGHTCHNLGGWHCENKNLGLVVVMEAVGQCVELLLRVAPQPCNIGGMQSIRCTCGFGVA